MKISHWRRLLAIPLIGAGVLFSGCTSSTPTGASWPGITVADQNVYLAFHKVYAIKPDDGSLQWFWPPALSGTQAFYSPPAVSENMVVVTDYTDSVFAIDRTQGITVWQFKTAGAPIFGLFPSKGPRFVGGAVIGEKYVYAASDDGVVHALNKDAGTNADGTKNYYTTEAWTYQADGSVWATPLLDGNTVYIATLKGHLYALNAETGELEWQVKPEDVGDPKLGPVVTTPTLHDGILYFGSFNNRVYALDTSTKKVVWSYQADHWVWSSPVYDEVTSQLVGADLDGNVFALKAEDGTAAWTYDMSGGNEAKQKIPIVGAPLLSTRADGTRVAVITAGVSIGDDPNVLVLNMADGKLVDSRQLKVLFVNNPLGIELSRSETVKPMYAPPAALDNLLLVGSHEGNVQIYALDSETLKDKWGFNSTQKEDAAKAAAAPADQGPLGGNSIFTQILPIMLVALLVFVLFGQRRPGGGK